MNHGRVEQVGTPADLYERPANRFVAEFLGESNFIAGVITGRADGTLHIRADDGMEILGRSPIEFAAGERMSAALRPEHVWLGAVPTTEHANTVAGTISEIIYLGDAIRYRIRLASGSELVAKSPRRFGEREWARSDRVTASWRPGDATLFRENSLQVMNEAAPDRRQRRHYSLLLSPAMLFLLILFVVPIGELLIRSIYDNGFTLRHYRQIIENPVYLTVIGLTFRMVTVVTLVCVLAGYPLALFVSGLSDTAARWVRVLVLIPLLISVIVRTYAWMVLLGTNGLVNQALQALAITTEPVKLLYSFPGVIIGMVYVMLPLTVLTLESVMRNIDPNVIRAAHNLGASRSEAFWRIFSFTLPGVAGGALLVFITSLGYYITPALLGGPKDAVIAMLIARQVEYSMN